MPDLVVDVRFVLPDPEDLWSSETGQGVIAGFCDQGCFAHQAADLIALRFGALVIPQDRGS